MIKEKTLGGLCAYLIHLWHMPHATIWRNEVHTDTEQAFGTLRTLLAKRKRLLREIEAKKNFRWHSEPVKRELRNVELNIRFAFFIPSF